LRHDRIPFCVIAEVVLVACAIMRPAPAFEGAPTEVEVVDA
jgi:hypothetical protein